MADRPPIDLFRERVGANASTADIQLGIVYDFVPDTIADFPALVVDTPEWRPITFGRTGPWAMELDCHLVVGTAWDEDAQSQLNELMGSVFVALESDRTLGGLGDCHVANVRPIRKMEVAEVGYHGARFTMEALIT